MIKINDKTDLEFEPGMTVETLLSRCGFTYPLLVVSMDGQIVPRDRYTDVVVPDGANVRVLHLVAGG